MPDIKIRVRDPADFVEDSFTEEAVQGEDGIVAIKGELKETGEKEVQALKFEGDEWDQEKAEAWTKENYPDAVGLENPPAEEKADAARRKPVKYYNCAFGEAGQAADPENPKVSEDMKEFERQVYAAMDAAGWSSTVNANPVYDFIIEALYTKSVVVVDYRTGDYYLIPLTRDGDIVTLGTPELYDIQYIPAEEKAAAPEAPAAASRLVLAKTEETNNNGVLVNAYEILIVSSGFSCDGRYFTDACIQDVFDNHLLDGVTCYYLHPGKDDQYDGSITIRRDDYMCAYIKPDSCRIEINAAGLLDIYGTAIIIATDPGKNVDIILAASLQANLPPTKAFLRSSVYAVTGAEAKYGKIKNRQALIFTKLHNIDAVDFVEFAALPRAGVTEQVDIAAGQQPNEDKNMPMTEAEMQAKIDEAEAKTKEANVKLAVSDHEKNVNAALAASGLPDDIKDLQRPVMMLMAHFTAENLEQYVKATESTLFSKATRPPVAGAPGADKAPDAAPALAPAGQDACDAIANAVGLNATDEGKAIVAAARQETFVNTGH